MTSAEDSVRQHTLGYVAQLFGFALPLFQNLVFPVLLGPLAFGALTVANGICYLPLALSESGFVAAMIWHTTALGGGTRSGRRTLRLFGSLRLCFSVLVAGAIVAGAPRLAEAYGLHGRSSLIRLAGLLFVCIGVYSVLDTFLISVRRNELSALARVFTNALCVGTPVVLWWVGRSPEAVITGMAMGFALSVLVAGALLAGTGILRTEDGDVDRASTRQALTSITTFSVLYFAIGMQSWGLVALAGLCVPAEEAGFLKIATGAVQASIALAPLPVLVVFSYLVSLRGDPERLRNYLARIVRVIALVSPGIVAAGATLAWRAVETLYGSPYSPVAALFAAIVPSQMALMLIPPTMQTLILLEGRRPTLRAFAALLVLELVAGLALARVFGVAGVALVLGVFPYLFLLWIFPRLARHGFRSSWRWFVPGFSAGVVLALVASACLAVIPGAPGLVPALVLGLAAYATVLWMGGGLDGEELRQAWALLSRTRIPPDSPSL